jgi:hypothetical protein
MAEAAGGSAKKRRAEVVKGREVWNRRVRERNCDRIVSEKLENINSILDV